jgi:hypothetical protein
MIIQYLTLLQHPKEKNYITAATRATMPSLAGAKNPNRI